ncbi:MAG: hypothetical protein J6D47_08225 [Peptostreptococcaceae bacterium]|jgi:hypothetical protein|nr:hypothetical protein [Peptostreptococcaceae bacterium]
MSKLDNLLRNFGCGCNSAFGGTSLLIIAVIVFLLLCTDILDNFFCDDTAWIWIVLIILLLFNFDDGCCC